MKSKYKIRKKNKEDVCPQCSNSFLHFKWDKQEFCSNMCYYDSLRDKRPKHNCASCGKEIGTIIYRERRSNEYYCNRECYDNRRKKNLKRLKRHTKFYDTLLEESQCECGVNDKFLLQIHHKDGNHNNNEPNNLEIVCGNCHIKRHLKKNKKGEYVYHPKSLTHREILKDL